MSTNPYYSEYQRKWMTNRIGKLIHKSFNANKETIENKYDIDDL